MKRFILIHYGEIGLKKSNKSYFVNKLMNTILLRLQKKFKSCVKINFTLERFLVYLEPFPLESELSEVLDLIFGIKNYQFVYQGSIELEKLCDEILSKLPEELYKSKNFKVRVKRSQKLQMNSAGIERNLGALLIKNGLNLPVKLENEDFCINLEIFNNQAFFSFKKYKGLGGMPVQSSGKFICLLSSGIDSPVSSFKMMKRGARIIYLHFHSYPYSDHQEIDNVKSICNILADFQQYTVLYLVPYIDYMKLIASSKSIPSRYRVLLYRRMMLRVAEKLAFKLKAKGLVTGDNLAQVASQTSQNLFSTHSVTSIPLYQPLISFDKEEIMSIAKQIGTYNISKLPCKDTCTMFTPLKPEISCPKNILDKLEEQIDLDFYIKKLFNKMEKFTFF